MAVNGVAISALVALIAENRFSREKARWVMLTSLCI